MSGKLVLIDGHSILNRAYYGIPELSNSKGLHTNAVYGFLNILFKVLDEEKAEYLTVAFDLSAPTFRHELYAEYKGTRKPMPEELREQVPVMKEVLRAMGVRIVEQAGLEADDILGTLAKRAEREGYEVSVISGDRDLLQLATDHIMIRIPKTKGGKTEVEDYRATDVAQRYQVTPEQFIDVKALMGDSSDNIPGVPKVGEKTATELIREFGSLDGLYGRLPDVKRKSVRESLEENRELAYLCRKLATINTGADVAWDMEEARLSDLYTREAYEWMKRLEFKNMQSRFDADVEQSSQSAHFREIVHYGEMKEFFSECKKAGAAGVQLIGDLKVGELLGAALACSEEEICFLPVGEELTQEQLLTSLQELFEGASAGSGPVLSTFGLKEQMRLLEIRSVERVFDTEIASYLINPLKNAYDLEDIANEYLGMMLPGRTQLFGKKSLSEAREEMPEQFLQYVCHCAYVNYKACEKLTERLVREGMESLFREVEMPLILCLYGMEREGIGIRPEELKEYGEKLSVRIGELEQSIHEQAGTEFNINSPKQLGEILFERMGIKGGKKTKTGYSTAADILEKLSPDYPIVSDILEYRGLTKLKSTYADGLAAYISGENRIHSTFNQTITATGRISSTEPNLQNIPIRMELGRLIRKVFVPRPGYIFIDADYSQIELRILAHMSGDERLIEAYNKAQDIHRITASEVFHTPFGQVTELQRRNAKAVNFGIVYGISSFGLSQDLSITRKEAALYIEKYFQTYPQVKKFLDRLVEEAKENGYVTTMFGRRRPVPELKSSNFMQRSFGERVAMNAPIQGTAADIIKIAMIRVDQELKRGGLKSRLILQVHDELLIEAAAEEKEQVKQILTDQMQGAAELSVKLEIDMHEGHNWYEAK